MNRSEETRIPPIPAPSVSPEAAIDRDPQTGQARDDPSLAEGVGPELSDGGANSARHTGDEAKT
jgi:hypothetical protein